MVKNDLCLSLPTLSCSLSVPNSFQEQHTLPSFKNDKKCKYVTISLGTNIATGGTPFSLIKL